MNKTEIIELFIVIQNTMPPFQFDDAKVNIWHKLLADTPKKLAEQNLYEHIMDPENKYPPTPGQLAKLPAEATDRRAIPNVEETKRMLQEQELKLPAGDRLAGPTPGQRARVFKHGENK